LGSTIYHYRAPGNFKNIFVHHNDISACAFVMRFVLGAAGSLLHHVLVFNNRIHDFKSQLSCQVHGDGIQFVSFRTEASLQRLTPKVANLTHAGQCIATDSFATLWRKTGETTRLQRIQNLGFAAGRTKPYGLAPFQSQPCHNLGHQTRRRYTHGHIFKSRGIKNITMQFFCQRYWL
jgi:hypothetical protein